MEEVKTDVLLAYVGNHTEDWWIDASIRKFAEFGLNLGRIVVAGNVPGDLPDTVDRFPIPPMLARGSRYDNAVDAVLKVIEARVLAKPFLYCPPCVLLTETTDLAAFPFYARRPRIRSVADLIRENKGGAVVTRYQLVLSDTRAALERNGYPAAEISTQHLVHIDPEDAPEAKRVWLEEPHGEFGYDMASLFGNLRAKRLGIQPTVVPG